MLVFFNHINLYRMKYDELAYICFQTDFTAQKPSTPIVGKDGKSLVSPKEVKDTKKKK